MDGDERAGGSRRDARRPESRLHRGGLCRPRDGAYDGVGVSDESTAKRVLKLIELLEEHDDVQSVWANYDIPDEILERVEL